MKETEIDHASSAASDIRKKENEDIVEEKEAEVTTSDSRPITLDTSKGDDAEVDIEAVDSQQQQRPEENGPQWPTYSNARLIALVITVTGASILNTISVQAAVIILPTIGEILDIPESRQQWIVSAYSLTFGCFLLLWGRLADVYGKRLIFIWGSAFVCVTTMVVPFAKNEIAFDVLRGLQGLGAAANVPTAIGILGVTFPPGKAKNYAFVCYGAGAPFGAILGNIIGGIIAQYISWRWVFWILSIVAALITVAGHFVIPRPSPQHPDTHGAKSTVDWLGGALITVGLLVLLFALTEGNVVGWNTPWVPVLIILSLALIALFILWQRRLELTTSARAPLMRPSLITSNPRFAAALTTMALFFATFNNYLVLATYHFQTYQGLSVIRTTLNFLPTGPVGILTAFTTGYLLARVPLPVLLTTGCAATGLSSLLFALPLTPPARPTSYAHYWPLHFPAMLLAVAGADTLYPCLVLFTAHALPPAHQALGGALVNAVAQVGRAIGLAVATALETAVIARAKRLPVAAVGRLDFRPGDPDLLAGLRAAEWLGVGMAGSAAVLVGVAFRRAGVLGHR